VIRLSGAFREVFDLIVFDGNFGTKETDLAIFFVEALFELLNIAERAGACSRLLRIIFLS